MKKVLTILLAAAAVAGCSKEQNESIATENSNVASFSASTIGTRTNFEENTWITGSDKIGITSQGFSSSTLGSEFVNTPYVATDNGDSSYATTDFTAVDKQIFFPNVSASAGQKVTFYAYYPYNESNYDSDNYLVTLDISGQKDNIASVDLMTAMSSEIPYYVNASYDKIGFLFTHSLVKVVLNITRNDNCPSLEGLTAAVMETYLTADYSVVGSTTDDIGVISTSSSHTTGNVLLSVDGEVEKATITALLHPCDYTSTSQSLLFTLGEQIYTLAFKVDLSSGKNQTYNYNIALGNDEAKFTGSSITGWDDGEEDTDDKYYPEEVTDDPIDFGDNSALETILIGKRSINTNSDSEISYAEAAAVIALEVTGTSITSLAELKYFTNLLMLDCNNCTNLTKLDLSANTKLTSLNCWSCALTELDITSCPDVGLKEGSYNSDYLSVGYQSDGTGTLTLYVTEAQYEGVSTLLADDTTVTVTVKK